MTGGWIRKRRRRGRPVTSWLCCTLAAAAAAPAEAQLGGIGRSAIASGVADRARSEYDATGIRIGGFVAFPSVAVQAVYDDNVLSSSHNPRDDAILSIRPRLLLRSDWSRNSLSLTVESDIQRYASLKQENNEEVQANVAGRYDVSSDVRVEATAVAAHLVEPRGTVGDILAYDRPIAYRLLGSSLKGTGTFGRISLQLGGGIDSYAYDHARIGGASVSQDYRDFRRVSGTARAAYGIGPGVALFVQGTLNSAEYTNERPTRDRDSHGYALLTGLSFEVTDLISGELGVGYLRQSFDDPVFTNIAGLDFDASLTWNPTPLLTISAEAARDVERAPFIGAGAVTDSDVRLTADYELLRQLIVTASAEYIEDRFDGIDRVDHRYAGRLGARYLLNRTLSLTADVSHRQQHGSGVEARSYSESAVRVGFTVRR